MRSDQPHEGLLVAGGEGPGREVAVQQRALLLQVLAGDGQLNDRDPGKHLRGVALLDDRLLQDPVAGSDHVTVGNEGLLPADRTVRDLGPEPGQAGQAALQRGDGLLRARRGALHDR